MQAVSLKKHAESESLSVEERIRSRAYELYVQRGCASGSELDAWLQAEDEILAEQDQHVEAGE